MSLTLDQIEKQYQTQLAQLGEKHRAQRQQLEKQYQVQLDNLAIREQKQQVREQKEIAAQQKREAKQIVQNNIKQFVSLAVKAGGIQHYDGSILCQGFIILENVIRTIKPDWKRPKCPERDIYIKVKKNLLVAIMEQCMPDDGRTNADLSGWTPDSKVWFQVIADLSELNLNEVIE
jgi:hypothetical protein